MLNSVSTREKQRVGVGSSTQAGCDVCVLSVPSVCVHGEAPAQSHVTCVVAAGLGGQGLAPVPKGWPAGDTGRSAGTCVVGRGCAWQVTKPSGDGQGVGTAEL